MTIIRPASCLQRRIGGLTKLAQETGEPIYLAKNGIDHLVLIDASAFEELFKHAESGDRNRA